MCDVFYAKLYRVFDQLVTKNVIRNYSYPPKLIVQEFANFFSSVYVIPTQHRVAVNNSCLRVNNLGDSIEITECDICTAIKSLSPKMTASRTWYLVFLSETVVQYSLSHFKGASQTSGRWPRSFK